MTGPKTLRQLAAKHRLEPGAREGCSKALMQVNRTAGPEQLLHLPVFPKDLPQAGRWQHLLN